MNRMPATNIPHLRVQLSGALALVQTKLIVNYGTSAVAAELRDISTKADDLNAAQEHGTLPALSVAATALAGCIERLDDPGRPAPCGEEKASYQACSQSTMEEFSDAFEKEKQEDTD